MSLISPSPLSFFLSSTLYYFCYSCICVLNHRGLTFSTFNHRIEEQLFKRAIQYYTNQVLYVKAHRELLVGRPGMHLLYIRHMFKTAFFTEMKGEPANALK